MSKEGAPKVMGRLASMFSPNAQAAIAAEEAADMLQQEQSIEQATIAATAATSAGAVIAEASTATATATVQAASTADADLSGEGLPAQRPGKAKFVKARGMITDKI